MASFKMLEQPANVTVDELCNLARRQMVIRDICRNEDYPEDGFNEISESVSSNIVSALTKMGQLQEVMEKKLQDLSQNFEEKTKVEDKRPPSNTNNADPSNRLRDFNQRRPNQYRSGNFNPSSRGAHYRNRYPNRGSRGGSYNNRPFRGNRPRSFNFHGRGGGGNRPNRYDGYDDRYEDWSEPQEAQNWY